MIVTVRQGPLLLVIVHCVLGARVLVHKGPDVRYMSTGLGVHV